MWEIVIILMVALIVLGPRQLAETARFIGKIYREIQKMTWEIRDTINLDSLTSPPPNDTTFSPGKEESEKTLASEEELKLGPGEKSGPDFYADLLESSEEEEKKGESDEAESTHQGEKAPEKTDEPKQETRP